MASKFVLKLRLMLLAALLASPLSACGPFHAPATSTPTCVRIKHVYATNEQADELGRRATFWKALTDQIDVNNDVIDEDCKQK